MEGPSARLADASETGCLLSGLGLIVLRVYIIIRRTIVSETLHDTGYL